MQTGSGKTYTMGTNPKEPSHRGLIFQIMNTIFSKIEASKHQSEFQLHVSFIEILKEEVRDLLDSVIIERLETSDRNLENAIPEKHPLQIRKALDEAENSGSNEVSVSTQKDMAACLEQGCSNRSIASTDMNNQSSRSHAIFTVHLEQKDKNTGETDSIELMGKEYRCAKLHLVDLAGSERAKRSGSEGVRLKEAARRNEAAE
ncbi:putative plus-end-directed kinesin ATPase [Helianthus annuus]|uniref:Plus-end-directed kinesin ATPase n=1 Tax=Helianthus annuus TaxID=4232 RepID=A0A9K3I7N0_HELAN|nr:putative plus-end-directed kinesin ATPase [Helianthus annuus]KAJ0894018.1 putative plus-end-directed kinesin ATPase [Helianthus annuus]